MSKSQNLKATVTIGSVLEKSVKKNIGFLKTGLSSVGDEIKGVERRQKELAKQRTVLERQGESVEALDREYEALGRTLDRLRRQQERWTRAAAASRRVGSSFGEMASDIGRKSRAIAIGVGLAGGAIFGLASSTAKLGDDVAKTAGKIGVGIETLQELRYAAERSGVATASFDTALEKMVRNIGLALDGSGAQADAFDALGLSASKLADMLPEEALAQIADRLMEVETQSEKAALASDIFGRSGIGMLNMLKDGSAGLVQLIEDARRTGYVLSEQATRAAEVFQDTLLDTQLILTGLKNTVGAELLPVVTRSMREIGDALVGNREIVKRWSVSFAEGADRALPVIGEVAVGIGKVLDVSGRVIGKTADMVGGWENLGVVIGGILASRTVMRVAKFGAAVFSLGRAMGALVISTPLVAGGIRAIGVALAANPIGLAITGIALGAIAIRANWESLGPWFEGLWQEIRGYFSAAANFVGGLFVGDMARAAAGLTGSWQSTEAVLGRVLGGIGSMFSWSYETLIRPITDKMGTTASIERAWSVAGRALAPSLRDIGAQFTGLGDVVSGLVSGDMQAAADGLLIVWSAARSQIGRVLGGIGSMFSWSYETLIRPITDKMGVTRGIEAAWRGAHRSLGASMDRIGDAFDKAWRDRISPTILGLASTDGISAAWETVKGALGPILTWLGDKFQSAWALIKPVIDGFKWVLDKGTEIGEAVSDAAGRAVASTVKPEKVSGISGSTTEPGVGQMSAAEGQKLYGIKPQKNALGGPFGPGWHLTGERGPELKFENRAGYVADNRAMRQLAAFADRIGGGLPNVHGLIERVRAAVPPSLMSESRVPAPAAVTQNIVNHFHASGVSAQELMALAERKRRDQEQGGLYDRSPASGPFGR